MAAMAGGSATTRHYFKGQKTKTDTGDTAFILDFDAQTITHINNKAKTYTVTKFSDVGAAMKGADVETKIDVKETGQKKTINGFNATEVIMTMEVETPQSAKAGGKMQMEMDMWLSSDVPGAKEVRAFYQKNAANLPWAALRLTHPTVPLQGTFSSRSSSERCSTEPGRRPSGRSFCLLRKCVRNS